MQNKGNANHGVTNYREASLANYMSVYPRDHVDRGLGSETKLRNFSAKIIYRGHGKSQSGSNQFNWS